MIRFNKAYISLIAIASILIPASCQDDTIYSPDYTVSGKEVSVTIPVTIPEMSVKTRAALDDNQLSDIKSLWIAVFNASTGEITSKSNDGEYGWYMVEDPTNIGFENSHKVTLSALSGPSHIVAVANVDNPGVTSDDHNNQKPLKDLLSKAYSWQDFLKISAVTPSSFDNVNTPSTPMVMSGCYGEITVGGTHPSDWQTTNFNPITIPYSDNGTVDLTSSGAIHLRHLMSHVTFNVKADPTAGNDSDNPVVNVNVLSYRIVNIPSFSWLYERGASSPAVPAGKPNFGDLAENPADASRYQEEVNFPSQYIESDGESQSFDFWQSENKHTGNIPDNAQDPYNLREAKIDSEGKAIYTSLCENDIWTTNNMASYVVLTCEVEYKDQIKVDADGVLSDNGQDVYRTGIAEYTVHLGYVDNDANDFNCFRNTDYTYNISVTGLNDIRVEAYGEGDRNAAEGTVIDAENPTILLDSHFSVFNIMLTREELENREDFGYIITTYQDGNAYTINETNDASAKEEHKNWVEIKRTSDASNFAPYCPAKGSLPSWASESDRVMPVFDFVKRVKNGEIEIQDENYFTVFVNEYTYEPRYGDENWGKENLVVNWTSYVNQNPRRFYIRVRRKTSEDGKSSYVRSKFSVEQQSIQTFYSTNELNDNNTAFGIEHTNETQGLNMRNSYTPPSDDNAQLNGRYNIWTSWLDGKKWADVVTSQTPQKIPEVHNLQNGPAILSLQAGRNPALSVTSSGNIGYTHLPATVPYKESIETSQYDPQPSQSDREYYIEAVNACMNRNRDENGDGVIDKQELKWYVPTSGKYLRTILGRSSLTSPIMPYDQVSSLPQTSNSYNSRYLIYSSNNTVVWAMEGLSSSTWNGSFTSTSMQPPWQVRCVRNLGTNLGIIYDDQVHMAYTLDESKRKITMADYDQRSIRSIKYTGKGNSGQGSTMPPHIVTDEANRVYKAFEYYETGFITGILTFGTTANHNNSIYDYITGADNVCSNLEGEGWRLPNQKELAIMRNFETIFEENVDGVNFTVGLLTAQYALCCTYSYFTTTGNGNSPSYNFDHNFLGSRQNGGTQLSSTNVGSGKRLYIRCVRDVEP